MWNRNLESFVLTEPDENGIEVVKVVPLSTVTIQLSLLDQFFEDYSIYWGHEYSFFPVSDDLYWSWRQAVILAEITAASWNTPLPVFQRVEALVYEGKYVRAILDGRPLYGNIELQGSRWLPVHVLVGPSARIPLYLCSSVRIHETLP